MADERCYNRLVSVWLSCQEKPGDLRLLVDSSVAQATAANRRPFLDVYRREVQKQQHHHILPFHQCIECR